MTISSSLLIDTYIVEEVCHEFYSIFGTIKIYLTTVTLNKQNFTQNHRRHLMFDSQNIFTWFFFDFSKSESHSEQIWNNHFHTVTQKKKYSDITKIIYDQIIPRKTLLPLTKNDMQMKAENIEYWSAGRWENIFWWRMIFWFSNISHRIVGYEKWPLDNIVPHFHSN